MKGPTAKFFYLKRRSRLVVAKSLPVTFLAIMLDLYCPLRRKKNSRFDSRETRWLISHNTWVKTQSVVKCRGQWWDDFELTPYLTNPGGTVPSVMDLRIPHNRWGSSSNPSLIGHLNYKILQYRVDCNNRPSHVIVFMTPIASTSSPTTRNISHKDVFWLLRNKESIGNRKPQPGGNQDTTKEETVTGVDSQVGTGKTEIEKCFSLLLFVTV